MRVLKSLSDRNRQSEQMLLRQTAGRNSWRKSGRGNESFLGNARYLLAQWRDHKFTRGEYAPDERDLKPFLLHFQFVNYGYRCFSKLSSSFSQDVNGHQVACACCFNHVLAKA